MSIYALSARTIEGAELLLKAYEGKTLLIVNVASKCGFTPQYTGLEALWRQFKDQGLVVLGFPCNQFGHQEPGDEAAIKSFCSSTYQVSFPLFAKVEVNGPNTHPIYAYLKGAAPGVLGSEGVKWNFTKFLVDKTGQVVKRYGSVDTPEKIAKDLVGIL
ncbi:MAG: glutathione peroxidase [Gammaproteobacteria bacterium]|nr:glutathione peroxidase [Gammaproteobacteria bacterium]